MDSCSWLPALWKPCWPRRNANFHRVDMRTLIRHLLASIEPKQAVTVQGWVRTRRDSKGFSFLELNDGSCMSGLQVVVDAGTPGYENIAHFTTGAAATVEGALTA